jgi:UDP:flavonoid glycosyltransferase YjiC (YdhE family)
MGEISFTSELSQDSGQLTRFLPLLERLRELGHSSHLILRDLSRLHHLVAGQAPAAFQAPLWLPRLVSAAQPLNYADILLAAGYADTRDLHALTNAWMRLFELNNSALVIADHSPTAMLAARIMQLPCVTLGSGFCSPPLLSPQPPLCWWQEANSERLQTSEDLVLASINEVLELHTAQPLHSLSELFDVEETFLRTFAELDHYPQRAIKQDPKPVYLGPELPLDGGEHPKWPDTPGPRVYASLDANWAGFEDLLKTLQALPISVLAHVPSLTTAQQQAYSSANTRVTGELQQLEAVRQQCQFAVCHGELDTVSAMLAAGRPLLLAPTQMEQMIVCRNVERLRAGLTLRTDTKRHPPKRLLKYLLEEPGFTSQAGAFALSYKDYDQEAARDAIAARCNEILVAATTNH